MPQLQYSLYMAKKRHIQKRQVFALYSFFVVEHTKLFFCCIKHVILLCTSLFSSLEWWSPKRNESCNPFILSYNITPNGFISKSEWVKCNSKIRRKTWHFLLKETDVASSKSYYVFSFNETLLTPSLSWRGWEFVLFWPILMALGLGIWPKKLLRVQIPGLCPPPSPHPANPSRLSLIGT